MTSLLQTRKLAASGHVVRPSTLQEIDPEMLKDPVVGGKEEKHYVGRGALVFKCFGAYL